MSFPTRISEDILKLVVKEPTKKVPFLCKLRHKWIYYEKPLLITSDCIRICKRCRRVEKGWIAYGPHDIIEKFEFVGYLPLDLSFIIT